MVSFVPSLSASARVGRVTARLAASLLFGGRGDARWFRHVVRFRVSRRRGRTQLATVVAVFWGSGLYHKRRRFCFCFLRQNVVLHEVCVKGKGSVGLTNNNRLDRYTFQI